MHKVPPTSKMTAEQALHVQFPEFPATVEDCAYRHSYPPSTKMGVSRKRTASIPIGRQSMRKSASEHRMAQDEAEADYKDFLFFSRVVDGISKQNSLLKDGSYLKSTNETLLDNIVRARHELHEKPVEKNEGFHNHYYYPSRLQLHNDFKIVTPTKDDDPVNVLPFSGAEGDHFHNDYEDEGVFDFEL